jgi:hypothetical protein
MPFLTSTEMFKTHLLNLFAYLFTQLSIFHYEELETFESFGVAFNFVPISQLFQPTYKTLTLFFPRLNFNKTQKQKLWVKFENVLIAIHFQVSPNCFLFYHVSLDS